MRQLFLILSIMASSIMMAQNEDIKFQDPQVRKLCVEQWGRDGHFTYDDAAKVTAIGVIRESNDPYYGSIQIFDEDEYDNRPAIRHFKELKYFRNLKIIGSYAFAGCDSLEDIELPSSLEEIRDYAFAFNKKLSRVDIPANVRMIGKMAFSCCDNLQDVRMPAATTLGIDVFRNSDKVKLTTYGTKPIPSMDDDIPFVDPVARQVCIDTWGHGGHFTYADAAKVTAMGEHRYAEKKYDDTSFVFDEIEATGRQMVTYFDELQFFTNLKNIDSYSFTQCEQLRSIRLPESVENIGDMAFVGCRSLKEIYIPDNCKNISRRAFTGCSSLEIISLPKGIHLGKDVFSHCNPDLKIIYR